jgi:hypothetical protein
MTSAWIDNGPVSLPPRSVVVGAAAFIALAAVGGVALGLRAGWRDTSTTSYADGTAKPTADDAITARPIVEIAAPKAPTHELTADEKKAQEEAEAAAKAKEIAARLAAAQAVQSSPDRHAGNIDDILTSASEKPPAPVKAPADAAETQPSSDVPF